ncbi:MAG TPA: uracil-DNA glycosylase [Bacteroidia bacterium]|nr:uracil-DNA glycosylase [Bacteroidia bacterium]HPA30745.1 uracil-DNA glycosylase [Bacteroidia bacterium]HQO86680.1 uracil-DNA glycosylase [Bacteroidia bacterium]HQP01075.1 uracil-DNA glycosylase [Bacteroidia bacterium]HRE23356.1 uracil-DNA glycosylase [Bacteroidia bacterium]
MESSQIKIEESWRKMLQEQFNMPYFEELKKFVKQEAALYKVFPPGPQIFSAFDYTPFEKARVVIIGQDPYHGAGQANGLCFSVSEGIKPPPSLVNIFKELKSDLNIPIPVHGNLEKWARQGVFLLNATLTVRQSMAGSHQGKGWEQFTDAVIKTLSEHKSGLVFLLWGRFAQAKEILIDNKKHHILKSAHPSPFSATKFFGCKHFSETNRILESEGLQPIDWNIN